MAARRRMAMRPPSFTELLPWAAFEPGERIFTHVDGRTLGMVLELIPAATEGKPDSFFEDVQFKIQSALQSVDESSPPWICQFFVNDDRNLEPLKHHFADYISRAYPKDRERSAAILRSAFTQDFIGEMGRHLDLVCKPEGLFVDTQVSGQPWRGQVRRVRCCLYRQFPDALDDTVSATVQLQGRADSLIAALQQAGIVARQCSGKDLYDWLLPFFNRNPDWCTVDEVANRMPYPGDREHGGVPGLTGFSDLLNLSEPESDLAAGVWRFDGVPVRALVLQNMTQAPQIGHFTAERKQGDQTFARFDRLPPNSMLSITMVVEPQHLARQHVERIQMKSRARTAEAQVAHAECEAVLSRMSHGDKFFPTMMTLYVSGQDDVELRKAITEVNSQLGPSGLRFVDPRHDLVPLDAFIRGLPMAFDPVFDAREMRRCRYMFASQVAALLPLYGRARGTGHPGVWMWNRGGEPLFFDPLNGKDRKKNAHLLMLGPTGAGKSATLNYMAMMAMAVHRPRMVIVDAGKSFRLLVEYFQRLGLSVYIADLSADEEVSLPPFVHALKLLQDVEVMQSFYAAENYPSIAADLEERGGQMAADPMQALAADPTLVDRVEQAERVFQDLAERSLGAAKAATVPADDEMQDDEADSTDKRDLLGEMMIAAIMMITGGEDKEIDRLTRADRYLISRAIIRAALAARTSGKTHPLTNDVAIELMRMASDDTMSSSRRERAEEMGQAMTEFTRGLRGKLFNRPGKDWPEVDVTLIEMGTLTREGYADALSLAYTSIVDSVQSRGERFQYEGRPLVFLTDEAHLITTSKLLGPMLAKAAKMWRKLAIWLWLATQNMKDFPESMSRVLSMCEWWVMLTMDKSEIEEVARFRSLTPEQRSMMESAVKEPPKYTEGVVMSALGQMLFRNVPPALPIALAMTEAHEKADRRRLMEKHGCNEVDAARLVARQLEASRA